MRLPIVCGLAGAVLTVCMTMPTTAARADARVMLAQAEQGTQHQPQQKQPQQQRARGGMSDKQLLQNPMVQQLLRDPELQQQIMDDPRFEGLMRDPQVQRLIQNPQVQRQMQQNQQLRQMYELQKRPLPGVGADDDD
jgi:hypothetical protein